MSVNYKIHLPNFEGPFDLLLYFIKRDEIDIYDIPIAKITEEFLSYIRYIKLLDLELAGDFILMASHLMQIKAQMLLPKHAGIDVETEFEDPRTELVQKLLEYKQYKEASIELDSAFEYTKHIYYREAYDADIAQFSTDDNYKNATLFDLAKAFKKIIERNKERSVEHRIELATITIEQQADNIIQSVRAYKKISFLTLVENQPKVVVALTFLAMLDLVRNNQIYFYQIDNFEDIMITDEDFSPVETEAA